MSNSKKPAAKPTSYQNVSKTGAAPSSQQARQQFFAAALTMSWQLAVVVIVPLLIGSWLDSRFKTAPVYTFVGFIVAIVGSAFVVRAQLQKVTPPIDSNKDDK